MNSTANNPASAGNLTLESLRESLGKLEVRRSVIAFVCRPAIAERVRDMTVEADLPSLGMFGFPYLGVEVLTDYNQAEDCLAFYDREALRVYLARNRVCSTPGCYSLGVRWWNDSEQAFYCEACSHKITAANPNLPGFNDSQFVKI